MKKYKASTLREKVFQFAGAVPKEQYRNIEDELDLSNKKIISIENAIKENLRAIKHAHDSELSQQSINLKKKFDEERDQFLNTMNSLQANNQNLIRFMEVMCNVGERYGLDLRDIAKKELIFPKKGIPVVPPHHLASQEILKQKIAKFKDDVVKINAKEDTKDKHKQNKVQFSEQQEEMIFCNNRSACVRAGAGSGKSTSLILRVIFFHKYLGISLNEITVCTFTRESRKDFIKKLLQRCKQWNIKIDHDQAKYVVRTFHSLAFELNKQFFLTGKKVFFESGKKEPTDENGVDIENALEPGDDDSYEAEPLTDTDISQIKLYRKLYTENDIFREKTNLLYLSSLKQKATHAYNLYNPEYDDEFTNVCLSKWEQKYGDELDDILSQFYEPGKMKLGTTRLNYHLSLPNINLKIFLGIQRQDCGEETIKSKISSKKKIRNLILERQNFCIENARETYQIVHDIDELITLIKMNNFSNTVFSSMEDLVPNFLFCCQGDFISNNRSTRENSRIYKQFSQLIDFSYSIGVPLYSLSKEDIERKFKRCSSVDKDFVHLAKIFHHAWIEELDAQNKISFDEIFHQFSDPDEIAYQKSSTDRLRKLNHLMIDEFQDISPNILHFLRQIKRHLFKTHNSPDGSLTCIGDDYQSIYGWRGSSAYFITEFANHFTTDHSPADIRLEENYRSHDSILRGGERVIDEVMVKFPKKHLSKGNFHNTPEPGCYFYHGHGKNIDYEKAADILEYEIKRCAASEENPIYILSRARSNRYGPKGCRWNALIKKHDAILKFLTIHSSKGLEASCVFLLGDIASPQEHPVREALYMAAEDNLGTYLNMQKDEAYRLAYVGITRAKHVLHWFFAGKDNNQLSFLLN
ncbi:UvrD-helicase domain-containing protein [Vibrio fluvialis]|uniref:UvrD-helicase domain-containing protein n=1 Tax=Vibrio fluvialis TaxID=676 RepID=UPI00301BD4A3